MNLRVVEGVVRRLLSDAEFRSHAIASPAAALSEYRLSQDEHAALTKLCLQLADGAQSELYAIKPASLWG